MNATQRRAETLAALMDYAPAMGFDRVPVHLMLAQAELESGGFTSNLCVNANNAWGMKLPRVRPTTAIGYVIAESGDQFAKYASLRDGARDYLMRQKNFGIPNTADPIEYMNATVRSGYAVDPDYLLKWADRYGLQVPGPVSPGGAPPSGTADAGGGGGALLLLLLLLWDSIR